MRNLLREYSKVERHIILVILAEFFVQLVNATFMNLQGLYMKAEGFSDGVIADFISWRFAGVLALALPLGLFIRGKKVKPFFYLAAAGVPFFALLIIVAVHLRITWLLILTQCLWGAMFTFIQVPVLPFILRNAKQETHTAALSLSFATWSFAGITSALIVWIMNSINPVLFSERNLLAGITLISFAGIICVAKMNTEEKTETYAFERLDLARHDWKLIGSALLPALVIATGAGLTIPFINLFFARVHGMETNIISIGNFFSALSVAFAMFIVPRIKERVGFKRAIPTTQSLAVLALIIMATTEYYKSWAVAGIVAMVFYVARQPLMNVAQPMTSEIAMKYVGRKNQEITSALISAIWSGSWFISTRFVFGSLRDHGYAYVNIFLVTAGLYALGVFLYWLLIRSYVKREQLGLIEK